MTNLPKQTFLLDSYYSHLREESGLLSTVGSPVVFCSFSGGEGPSAEHWVLTTKQIKIMHTNNQTNSGYIFCGLENFGVGM